MGGEGGALGAPLDWLGGVGALGALGAPLDWLGGVGETMLAVGAGGLLLPPTNPSPAPDIKFLISASCVSKLSFNSLASDCICCTFLCASAFSTSEFFFCVSNVFIFSCNSLIFSLNFLISLAEKSSPAASPFSIVIIFTSRSLIVCWLHFICASKNLILILLLSIIVFNKWIYPFTSSWLFRISLFIS